MPAENLLQPDAVRRLTWEPPEEITEESVTARLRKLGAREWQLSLTARPLTEALAMDRRLETAGDSMPPAAQPYRSGKRFP